LGLVRVAGTAGFRKRGNVTGSEHEIWGRRRRRMWRWGFWGWGSEVLGVRSPLFLNYLFEDALLLLLA
jgi:hypothetical protein